MATIAMAIVTLRRIAFVFITQSVEKLCKFRPPGGSRSKIQKNLRPLKTVTRRRKALRRLGTCRQVERRTINSTETQSLSGYKSSPVTNTCTSLWWRMRGSISRRREGGCEGVEEGGTPVDVTTASRDTNRRWEYCPSPPPPTISRSTSKWVRFAIKCSVRNAVQCTVQLCMLHGTFM